MTLAGPHEPDLRFAARGSVEAAWGAIARGEAAPPTALSVPVVDPGPGPRRARWARVLDWYQATALPQAAPALELEPAHGVVVCVDPELQGIAAGYAAATGRRLAVADDADAMAEQPARFAAAGVPVLLVGRADRFPNSVIQRVAEALDRPWGVAAGADVAAVSFLLRKALADWSDRATSLPVGAVDAIHRTARHPSGIDPSTEPVPADFPTRVRTMVAADWDGLVVYAHGESGHARLGDLVLCGLVGEEEAVAGRRLPGGCHREIGPDGGTVWCKRRQQPDWTVMPTDAMRARRLLLLTCNSCCLTTDMYPSTTSLLLAAAEGYSAAVLGVDRLLPVTAGEADLALALLADGHGVGTIQQLRNDEHVRSSGAWPFVLLGDPEAPGRASAASVTAITTTRGAVPPSTPGGPDRPGPGSVVGPAPGSAPSTLFVGRRSVVAVVPLVPGGPAPAPVERAASAQVASQAVAQVEAAFSDLVSFEWSGPDFASEHVPAAALDPLVAALTAARLAVVAATVRARRALDAMNRRAVWDEQVVPLLSAVAQSTTLWDGAAAALFGAGLIQADAHLALTDGARLEERRTARACERCACFLTMERFAGPAGAGSQRWCSTCPNCGARAVWPAGEPEPQLLTPSTVAPGHGFRATLRGLSVAPLRGLLAAEGILVVQLKDNGRGVVTHRAATVEAGPDIAIDVPVDRASASELHTLRAAWVRGLSVTYLRSRIACVPGA